MPADRADKTTRPAQPLKVVQAVRVGSKPGLELTYGPRIMCAGMRILRPLSLLRLSGDPNGLLLRAQAKLIVGRYT